MSDLIVIYRVCGSEVDQIKPFRPSYFSKAKCFKTAWEAFKLTADFFVIWDGPENQLSSYILKELETLNLSKNFIRINYKSNQESLLYCYSFYKERGNKRVYFIEDDYLHLPWAYNILNEGLNNFNFVSLYDHPDRGLQRDITSGKEQICYGELSHWRSAISTTCSFATNKETFEKTAEDFIHFCKIGVGAPEDHKCWLKLYNDGYKLFTCIPGVSTHMVNNLLSPYINWDWLSSEIKTEKI